MHGNMTGRLPRSLTLSYDGNHKLTVAARLAPLYAVVGTVIKEKNRKARDHKTTQMIHHFLVSIQAYVAYAVVLKLCDD